jgi:hypothetical protein
VSLDTAVASFRERIAAFHASLPEEEQALLDQVLARAQSTVGDEVSGYAATDLLGEVPPVGRSRGLRGLVGLGLTVVVLPLDRGPVAEAGVQAPVVVGVDPGEDRPASPGAVGEPVAGHELAFER